MVCQEPLIYVPKKLIYSSVIFVSVYWSVLSTKPNYQ